MSAEGEFWFKVTPRGEAFCLAIVHEMCRLFSISKPEALLRVNSCWGSRDGSRSVDFVLGQYKEDPTFDLRFHETPEYWAKRIYYGPGVYWWLTEESLLKPFPLSVDEP